MAAPHFVPHFVRHFVPHFVMAASSSSRFVAASLALGLLAACAVPSTVAEPDGRPPAEPAKDTPAQPQTFTTKLACTHELGPAGELRVNDLPTGLAVALEPPSRVRTFPYTADAILLAVGSDTPWWPFFGDGGDAEQTLWVVPCDQPSELRQLLNIDGADFSWAAPDPAGGGLYFSLGAVQRHDFAAGDYGPVSPAPMIQQCWMAEQPVESRAYVAGWVGDDRLLIHVGGPCGFEAEWEGGTAILELGGAGQPVQRQPSAHVGTIVGDAAGRLWVGDGGQCAAPQTVWDRGEPGVWRSDDRGHSWRFLPIPALAGRDGPPRRIGHGIDALWVAGDRVLARAECCFAGPADGCDGGELLRSDDAGTSWRDITPTLGGAALEFPPSVVRVHVGGSLDTLEVELDVDEQPAFASRDGGRKWTPLAPDAEVDASAISRSATLGDSVFEATIDGVSERGRDGSARVVLRPMGAPTWWNGG